MAIKSPDAVRARGKGARHKTIGRVGGACRGLRVKVHAQELQIEAVEMGDVWDEVHEVRELARE